MNEELELVGVIGIELDILQSNIFNWSQEAIIGVISLTPKYIKQIKD